jgi:type IV secretory pathway VirB2 component (pilin)
MAVPSVAREEAVAVPSPVTAEGAALPADDVLARLASQLRSPLLMLLAVTVLVVVGQMEITG